MLQNKLEKAVGNFRQKKNYLKKWLKEQTIENRTAKMRPTATTYISK